MWVMQVGAVGRQHHEQTGGVSSLLSQPPLFRKNPPATTPGPVLERFRANERSSAGKLYCITARMAKSNAHGATLHLRKGARWTGEAAGQHEEVEEFTRAGGREQRRH